MALERPAALVFEASTTTHSDHELPLTYFSIGMWKKRDRTAGSIVLLVLNMTKKFVFLVESRMSVQAGPSRRLQKVLRQISASSRSPFNSSNRQSNYVVAFEVEWGEIVGLDYLNRLCEDGRVALEAQQTVKREFQTMRDAKTFYLPAKTPSNPTSPEILGPRTQRWPPPSTWTVPSHIFECRTVIFQFTDPFVPSVLRPAIQSNERLLKLYESGLPAWAMFMPAYGLWYRPWMRRVTYLLFIAISIFSMACGFYDLYKNVPYLDKVLRRVIGSLYLPSSAIFQWLEEHAQIRLSILLTYLFGKSMLFMQLLRWLGQVAATCRTALQPVADVLGPPFASLALLMQAGGRQVLEAGLSTGVACATLGRLVFGPPARLVWTLLQLFAQVLLPFYQVLKAVVMGPVAMVVTFLQYLFSGAGALWAGMRVMCSALTSTARAINSSARLAPAVQASAREVSWWYVVPADALELVRVSAMKSFRAVQAVTRFLIQICCDTYKHRLTLGMRMSRSWDAFKLHQTVSVNPHEAEQIATSLGLDDVQFRKEYIQDSLQQSGQLLLRKNATGTACIFLGTDGRTCKIYENRPIQCRTYPWWPELLTSSHDWAAEALRLICKNLVLEEIRRSGEMGVFSYEELEDLLENVSPELVDDFAADFWEHNKREVLFESQQGLKVLQSTIGVPPQQSRSLIFSGAPGGLCYAICIHKLNQQRPLGAQLAADLGIPCPAPAQPSIRTLILGAGGCALPMSLRQHYPSMTLEAVELDPEVLQLAQQYFGACEDGRLKLQAADAVPYTISLPADVKYDIVLVDAALLDNASPGEVVAPPPEFLQPRFVQQGMCAHLREGGVVADLLYSPLTQRWQVTEDTLQELKSQHQCGWYSAAELRELLPAYAV
ncbi:hypothetical protein WJX72_010299 [[Myrmecia] bisecta]|uniref:Spermine synthase n=1 Tax=[Myrmecia] bisecta TaxID=41462 RepID=A0AAW1QGP8_9CHLO